MLRLILFISTNLLVCASLSVLVSLLCMYLGIPVTVGPSLGTFVFCFIFGMVGSLISLQMSRWLAKTLMGVRLIDDSSREAWVYRKVIDISKRAGLKGVPEVGIWDDASANAFATGPSERRCLVAVSTGLLANMSEEEVEAVIAHEIAHIKNGDMVTMALLQGLANAFVMFFSRVFGWAASQAVDEDWSGVAYNVVYFVSYICLFILAGMLLMWFSRRREFRADAGAAKLVGRDKMERALARLGQLLEGGRQAQMPEALAAFGICSSSKRSWWARMNSSHPEISERIAALRA